MSQYALKVKQSFEHPDGRIFLEGHDCSSLDIFEVSDLANDYPEHFEAGNEITAELMADPSRVAHYAEAVQAKRIEQGLSGNLKASKK